MSVISVLLDEVKRGEIARERGLIVEQFAKMLTKHLCILIVRDSTCTVSFLHLDGAARGMVMLEALFEGPHCLP